MKPVTLLLPNNLAGVIARRHLARIGHRRPVPGHLRATGRAARGRSRWLRAGPRPGRSWRRPGGRRCRRRPGSSRRSPSIRRPSKRLPQPTASCATSPTPPSTRSPRASTLGPDLVRLHRHVTAELGARLVRRDRPPPGRGVAPRGRARLSPELGALVLYLPQELTQAEAAFVEALGTAAADLTVIVGLTDVRRADRAVRRSLERIGIDLPTSISKNYPVATEVLNASDADDEVRCVVRDVVASLEHTPAHRIAVLYSAALAVRATAARAPRRRADRGQRPRHATGARARDRPDPARGARARRSGSAARRRVPRAGERADARLHRRADPGAAVGAHVPGRRCGSGRRLGYAARAVRRG